MELSDSTTFFKRKDMGYRRWQNRNKVGFGFCLRGHRNVERRRGLRLKWFATGAVCGDALAWCFVLAALASWLWGLALIAFALIAALAVKGEHLRR